MAFNSDLQQGHPRSSDLGSRGAVEQPCGYACCRPHTGNTSRRARGPNEPARPFFRKFVPGTVFILHLGPRHAVFWPEDYLILCTRASCLEPAFSVQGKVLQILKKHAKEPNKEFGFFARTPVRGNRSIIFSEQIIVQSENKRSIDFCEQILLQSQDKRSI